MELVYVTMLLLLLGCSREVIGWSHHHDFAKEQALRDLIFTTNNYNANIRPATPVLVQLTLAMYTMKNLDIKEETMDSSLVFSLVWDDSRISWAGMTNYTSIDYIYVNPADVWLPKLAVANSVNSMAILAEKDAVIKVWPQGLMVWSFGKNEKTHCYVDVTFYPFDTQTCDVSITLWGQDVTHVNYTFNTFVSSAQMEWFRPNGEWEFVKYDTFIKETVAYGQTSKELRYLFTFRRRPDYHVINSLLPVVLFSSMSCAIYKLPADSGEKVGFALTVLLGFAVYLTILTDFIPSTSLYVSYLSIYLVVVLTLCVVSVFITLFVLSCYHADTDKPVPKPLSVIIKTLCMPITCRTRCCKNNQISKISKEDDLTVVENMSIKQQNHKDHDSLNEELSWQHIGKIADDFFFIVSVTVTLVMTVVVFAAFGYGYQNPSTPTLVYN